MLPHALPLQVGAYVVTVRTTLPFWQNGVLWVVAGALHTWQLPGAPQDAVVPAQGEYWAVAQKPYHPVPPLGNRMKSNPASALQWAMLVAWPFGSFPWTKLKGPPLADVRVNAGLVLAQVMVLPNCPAVSTSLGSQPYVVYVAVRLAPNVIPGASVQQAIPVPLATGCFPQNPHAISLGPHSIAFTLRGVPVHSVTADAKLLISRMNASRNRTCGFPTRMVETRKGNC